MVIVFVSMAHTACTHDVPTSAIYLFAIALLSKKYDGISVFFDLQ